MQLDPDNYDPDELRRIAETRTHGARRTAERETGDPSRRDGRESDESARRRRGGGGFAAPDERTNGAVPRRERGNGQFSFGNVVDRPDRAGDRLRSNELEQLFLYQSAADEVTKPYLRSLPDSYASERVVFDWLEFLVLKAGFKRTFEALRYYRSIDWITDDVSSALEDYLIGFSDDVDGGVDLAIEDHQLSLVYVARLASMGE